MFGYIRAYKRFNNPRGLAHMAGGLLAILVLTAPALLLIQTLLHKFWIFKDKSRVFEPGFLVWQFILSTLPPRHLYIPQGRINKREAKIGHGISTHNDKSEGYRRVFAVFLRGSGP